MKPWGLDSYRSPRLTIDEVVLDPGRNQPMITKGSRAYEIDVNGLGPDPGTVVDFLHRLRDPAWEGWRELCGANREDSPWQELTRQMDSYGLLMDDDSWGVTAAETENAALAKMVDELDAWLARAAELAPAARFHRLGERLLHDASALLSGFVQESFPELARDLASPEAVPLPRDEPNFYLRALLYALRYWRRAAPLSLACAVDALDRRFPGVAGSAPGPLAREVRARLAGGPYDLQDVQAHLNSLAVLLLLGASPDSDRVCTLPESFAQPRPALNLMIEAEHRALEWLEALGLSRYQQALEEGRAMQRLAEGTYLHQYHVSRRFVEVITPMLLKRLRSPLRTKLFEYFGEELGHEEFELAACRSLGMSPADVEASIPLPLFSVYLEVLSVIAEVDPVGFLLSVLVTEGLPGTHTPVNSIFEKHGIVTEPEDGEAIHQHEELNLTLDHSTMARRLTLEVPSVPPAAQHRALDHFAFMLELNNRAWNMLHDYSVDETLPACPGWLGVSPDQVWTWVARAEA